MTYVIIWLLLGVAAIVRMYYSSLKDWYNMFGYDYWEFDKRNGGSSLQTIITFSPMILLGGGFSLFLAYISFPWKAQCWYFKCPKK